MYIYNIICTVYTCMFISLYSHYTAFVVMASSEVVGEGCSSGTSGRGQVGTKGDGTKELPPHIVVKLKKLCILPAKDIPLKQKKSWKVGYVYNNAIMQNMHCFIIASCMCLLFVFGRTFVQVHVHVCMYMY